MELTTDQRAELEAIVTAVRYSSPAIDQMRGGDKTAYRARRDRLNDLLDAWRAVDVDTRMTLVAMLVRMGDDFARDSTVQTPDLEDAITEHLSGLALPSGNRERTEGFREAVLFLWNVWIAEQPLNRSPAVGEAALGFIAPIIAETFDMPVSQAKQRTYDRLRAFEKTEGGLPRRS